MSDTLEKIVCCPNGNSNNDMLTAMLASNGGMNGNQFNNPIWLIWAMLFGNGGFGGFGGNNVQNAEIMNQLNSLRTQIGDNNNFANIQNSLTGINNNQRDNMGAINMGFAGTNAAISNASMQNLLSQKDASAQMASCCCDIKSNILNQTNQLQSRIDQLANGTQQGFASLGYAISQQTNELNTNANANTQRILDKMCQSETQGLRDKLAQASQDSQTAQLIAALKTTA